VVRYKLNTHEAIIDRELWDIAQDITEKRYKPRKHNG